MNRKGRGACCLYEELKTAALAEASAEIVASNQIIQRLTQQLKVKERLAQEVAELQQQLELQNQEGLRAQQLKAEKQELEQQVVKLREKLHHTAGNLAFNNQEIVKVEKNLDNQQNYRDNSSITVASQRDDNTKNSYLSHFSC
jgi:septation ring formation regulator EzrA